MRRTMMTSAKASLKERASHLISAAVFQSKYFESRNLAEVSSPLRDFIKKYMRFEKERKTVKSMVEINEE
jgi:hypothetical protein